MERETSVNRRNFLFKGSLFAGGSLFLPSSQVWAATSSSKFEFTPADQTALSFVRQYSSDFFLQGGGITTRLAGKTPSVTKILAKVRDLSLLSDALTGATKYGISTASAQGNAFTFTLGEQSFYVENLLPADFAVRIAELREGKNVIFAQDALLYQPTNGNITDALKPGRELKLVRKNGVASTALEDVLLGIIASKEFGLKLDADFIAREQAVLSVGGASTKKLASDVVSILVKNLPALVAAISADEIADLFKSHLLTTAFAVSLRTKTAAIVSSFKQWRTSLASSFTDTAIWLAAIIGNSSLDAIPSSWISSASHGTSTDFLDALTQAQTILAQTA